MAHRKQWDDLSPAYRRRLERAGITRADYERGVSLSAARGHKHTPERPEQAKRNPKRYKKYLQARMPIRVVTTQGITVVDGLRKKDRSRVARHWNAIGRYLDTGKTDSLSKFDGVTIGGYDEVPEYELETRLDPLDDYQNTGDIEVDSIYESGD
jgi:hypothetical protein